jgi:aspartyl-tRNA synthetase
MKRTHHCNALRKEDIGRDVTLIGWVGKTRDLGALLFIDLTDREGLSQVVIDRNEQPGLYSLAKTCRSGFVVGCTGRVFPRGEGNINPSLPTGEIEVHPADFEILSPAEVLPLQTAGEEKESEEVRLRYRYLDLRRPRLQKNLALRHRVVLAIRKFLDGQGFLEIETPVLSRSTPEGARDFLVPSRVNPGRFYALPQSPQLFKQLLMVSGFEKYFQIVKCFRDEDLRANRQPEFTQVDLEMSFVEEEDVIGLLDQLLADAFRGEGFRAEPPFRRMTYREAMDRFGTDRPDLRFDMEIRDITDLVAQSSFRVFSETAAGGGVVRGLKVGGGADYSRKKLQGLEDRAKLFGAAGLLWIKLAADGISSPIAKFLDEPLIDAVTGRFEAAQGDLILLIAGKRDSASRALGELRIEIAREENLIPGDVLAFVWVTEFPLFEMDDKEGRLTSSHHPFTSPRPEDLDLLETEPLNVRARAYDIVLNGQEIGGGSIRIHDSRLQRRVFKALGISEREAEEKFSFLLEGLSFGAPPHGGIALGLDRLVMIMAGEASIRDVIAFPKTTSALCLMTGSPSAVDGAQLKDLHLRKTD